MSELAFAVRIAPGLVLWPILLVALALLAFPKWTVDDAYITCRYAENLALRGELNWNPGEDPVEGYTGVALPVLLASAARHRISPVFAGRAIGCLSFFAAATALVACLARTHASTSASAMALSLFHLAPFQLRHATSGLETMLYAFALLTALAFALACAEATHADRELKLKWGLLATTLLICGLVRPEGALLGPIVLIALFPSARANGTLRTGIVASLLCLALPGAAYFAWRWSYYGHFLPNTFYAKEGGGFVWMSVRSMFRFLGGNVALPAAAALLYYNPFGKPAPGTPDRSDDPSVTRILIAFGLFTLLAFIQYTRSVPLMNFAFRFFAPYYGVILVIIAATCAKGLSVGFPQTRVNLGSAIAAPYHAIRGAIYSVTPPPQPGGRGVFLRAWLAVALLTAQFAFSFSQIPNERAEALKYKTVLEDEHVKAANLLKQTLPPESRIITFCDAGVISYLTRLKVTDFGVLNDERLARGNMTEQEMIDYFFSVNADAVVFTSQDWERLSYKPDGINIPAAETIAADPRFARYALAEKFRTTRTPVRQRYYEFVYLRKELTEHAP